MHAAGALTSSGGDVASDGSLLICALHRYFPGQAYVSRPERDGSPAAGTSGRADTDAGSGAAAPTGAAVPGQGPAGSKRLKLQQPQASDVAGSYLWYRNLMTSMDRWTCMRLPQDTWALQDFVVEREGMQQHPRLPAIVSLVWL
jgi:hypothetical protein